jgi:hypothetical protein
MEQVNILIIGNCGVGKTYIMQNIIKSFQCNDSYRIGQLHYKTNGYINITGKYDSGIFQGSDKLSMSVMTSVDDYLQNVNGVNIFEGDRFTNKNFIKKANPFIIKINGNGINGRFLRNSTQSTRQIKSIETRINNIEYDFSFDDSYLLKKYLQTLLNSKSIKLIKKVLQSDKDNYIHKQQTLF